MSTRTDRVSILTNRFNCVLVTHKDTESFAVYLTINNKPEMNDYFLLLTRNKNNYFKTHGPWKSDLDLYESDEDYKIEYDKDVFYFSVKLHEFCYYIKNENDTVWDLLTVSFSKKNNIENKFPKTITDKEYMLHKLSNFETFRDLLGT